MPLELLPPTRADRIGRSQANLPPAPLAESISETYYRQSSQAILFSGRGLFVAEKLFSIFDEADEHHDSRASKPDEEHDRQQPDSEDSESHEDDCSRFAAAR